MKKYEFEVVMRGCIKRVWAFNDKEAIIIAQAEAIKEGFNYEVLHLYNLTLYP